MLLTWGRPVGLMDLNLIGANTLDGRFTFTRALPAKRYNASGILVTEAANTPRFDYNPFTLAARGLMLEPTRTNLALHSNEFDDPVWAKNNVSIAPNTTVSPDGTNNADSLTVSTATTPAISQPITAVANTAHAISVHLRNDNASWVMLQWSDTPETEGSRAWFNLVTGAKGSVGSFGTGFDPISFVEPGNNGWNRYWMVATLPLTTAARVWVKPVTGDGSTASAVVGTRFDMYEAQPEQGTIITSNITTGASQVTRDGDLAIAMGMGAPAAGSLILTYLSPAAFSAGFVACFDDGTTSNQIGHDVTALGGAREIVITSAVPQCTANTPGLTAGAVNKVGMRWARNNFAITRAGNAPVLDTNGSIPNTNRFQLGGRAGAVQAPVWLQGVQLYGLPFPDATLRALAA